MAIYVEGEMPFNGPHPSELIELLEKQDLMMDSLQDELAVCREEIRVLTEAEQKRQDVNEESMTLTAEAEKKVRTALATVEALHLHNEKLEKELAELRKQREEDRPVATVIQLREKIKEVEFELEQERRSRAALALRIEEHDLEKEQLKHELSTSVASKTVLCNSLSSKLEAVTKELAETKFKLEELVSEKEHSTNRLSSEVEILSQKEQHLDVLVKQLSEEVSSLRKEKAVMSLRVSALTQENASLRTNLAKRKLDSTVFAGSGTEEQMSKLLADQSHLIAALREESSLLADRLEEERREAKLKIKQIKREKRELEDSSDNEPRQAPQISITRSKRAR